MIKVTIVITNGGDGSSGLRWVQDPAVLERMLELADDGDEAYATGDGLAIKELMFPEGFDLEAWFKLNRITLINMDYMKRYYE